VPDARPDVPAVVPPWEPQPVAVLSFFAWRRHPRLLGEYLGLLGQAALPPVAAEPAQEGKEAAGGCLHQHAKVIAPFLITCVQQGGKADPAQPLVPEQGSGLIALGGGVTALVPINFDGAALTHGIGVGGGGVQADDVLGCGAAV